MNQSDINILYVDDEEQNIFLFEVIFGHLYKVHTATSGERGLEILNSNTIDVVITDLHMPNMNGLEFINLASTNFEDIPYFVLSGYSFNQAIEEAMKAGLIKKYFRKPFNKDEIELAISQELSDLQN